MQWQRGRTCHFQKSTRSYIPYYSILLYNINYIYSYPTPQRRDAGKVVPTRITCYHWFHNVVRLVSGQSMKITDCTVPSHIFGHAVHSRQMSPGCPVYGLPSVTNSSYIDLQRLLKGRGPEARMALDGESTTSQLRLKSEAHHPRYAAIGASLEKLRCSWWETCDLDKQWTCWCWTATGQP